MHIYKSIILLLSPLRLHFPHYCNAIALLLRNLRPPTPGHSLLYDTHHAILVMAISCKAKPQVQPHSCGIQVVSLVLARPGITYPTLIFCSGASRAGIGRPGTLCVGAAGRVAVICCVRGGGGGGVESLLVE